MKTAGPKIRIIVTLSLIAVMLLILGLKIIPGRYRMEYIVPQDSYTLSLHMSFTGNGDDAVVRTFLPRSNDSQTVTGERISSGVMNFSRSSTPLFERGEWLQYELRGYTEIEITYEIFIKSMQYLIEPSIPIPDAVPERMAQWVLDSESIQVNSPEIQKLSRELAAGETALLPVLVNLFDYVQGLGSKPFKGTTDALTALRLQEASCNGKSRLFVALTRALGIPSRLVGGLILDTGSKRTSHQWAEVFAGGYWIPFDTLNDHFAELPDNYLRLYTGDEVLFTHSRNIGFDYRFDIRRKLINNQKFTGYLGDQSLNLYRAVERLLNTGFSLDILQFLLVIPFGVLFVVIFNNVVGFKTFGTFLPALMAMAVQETGLPAGIITFVLVLFIIILLRIPLEKMGILHTPKLAIMMIGVVLTLISISTLSISMEWKGFSALNSASLFPIAILTITSERLAVSISEDGMKCALLTLIQTLAVMSVCYFIMSSVALKALVMAFPELLLGVLAINLWIGSWTGIRLLEFYRFRALLFKGEADNEV